MNIKTHLLLGLLVGIGLPGCQVGRPNKRAQAAYEQALAAALPRVREWVQQGNLDAAEFLFERAYVDDLGENWWVAVPLATLNPPSELIIDRFRGATFSVNKVTGEVKWLGIER